MVLVLCEMQLASSRIWTHVAVSISYSDNHYITGTSSQRIQSLANRVLLFQVFYGVVVEASEEVVVLVNVVMVREPIEEGVLIKEVVKEAVMSLSKYLGLKRRWKILLICTEMTTMTTMLPLMWLLLLVVLLFFGEVSYVRWRYWSILLHNGWC